MSKRMIVSLLLLYPLPGPESEMAIAFVVSYLSKLDLVDTCPLAPVLKFLL